ITTAIAMATAHVRRRTKPDLVERAQGSRRRLARDRMNKMRRTSLDSKRIAVLATGLAASVAASMAASAQQAQPPQAREWSMDAGLEHSDNIRRTDDGSASDTIAQAGLTINFANTRPRLDTQIG